MKKSILVFTICLCAVFSKAQGPLEINGTLKDSTGYTVIGAAVKLTSPQDTLLTITDIDGKFTFRNLKSPQGSIAITALGYKTLTRRYNLGQMSSLTLSEITLTNDSKMLSEVVVDGTPDVVVKEDTLQYRADQYKLKDNALAEDLLKKLPGVEVDREGNVTTQGKQVTRIRVNGKDFFGGDVKTATQNLPADVLENVQIIDDYGDQANLTGVKEGEPDKILNFTIRPDRNKGYLTRGTIGAGDRKRYQASVFAAKFNNSQQISVLANLNNTNANIFNLTGGGGGGRRGQGAGGGGGFNSSGLTNVNSIGINYRDQWSDKVTAYGSYSFFSRNNELTSSTFQKNLGNVNNQNTTVDNNRETVSESDNINHRFDFNIEYKMDSLNYLKLTPRVSFSTTDRTENAGFQILRNDVLSSDGDYIDITDSRTPNFGTDVLYNHRFAGSARNLSISAYLNTSTSKNSQDYLNESLEYGNDPIAAAQNLYRKQLIENDNSSNNINISTSFIEPLSKTKSLEFNYEYGFNKIDNSRTVLGSDDESLNPTIDTDLSNDYAYSFTTNRIGLNYRVRQEKFNYTLGMGVQPSVLKGESLTTGTIKNNAVNIYPSARFQYKFSRTKEFNINYNGRSNQPSYNQLQPVVNNSNPQFVTIGNPGLEAEFTNRINLRFNSSDVASGRSFFSNLNFNFTKDKIVSTTRSVNDPDSEVIQERGYTNADGYYTINGFYSYNKQLKDKKYVFGLRGMANYNNNISFIDDQKNVGRNIILSQRLQIQIQPNDWLELVPSINYTYNRNNNTISQRSNTEIHTWSTAFDSKIYFTKTFLWGTQADKNFNRGYSNISENPFIINTYLEKQFFKGNTGALRLTAFDLLDESTAISRTVSDSYILDSRSNRLSRYFMLTFTMRINKFAGNSNNSMPGEGGGRWREGGGPGGRP
jgi:hypothetical protein